MSEDNRPFVIRFEAVAYAPAAARMRGVAPGAYLESFDPEYGGGRGFSAWTVDPAKALRFEDFSAAMATWQTIPTSRPRRPDGKPNRPLTAYTVTFERIGPKAAG